MKLSTSRRVQIGLAALVISAASACGSSSDSTGDAAQEQTTVTASAPLLPELRLDVAGGIGTLRTWIDDWNTVAEAVAAQDAAFPDVRLAVDDFFVGSTDDGIVVFGGFHDSRVALGGALQADDGGISALMMFGAPDDPLFFAIYGVWLATLNPTLEAEQVLPPDVAFGDGTRNAVVLGGRSYEAVRTASTDGEPLITVSMVPGLSEDQAVLAGSHALLRSSVLGYLGTLN
ncbi:MAG: hypothetical protein ACKVHU_13745 [Acidimicrobiales bacterium]|jgi:hypothetical protein